MTAIDTANCITSANLDLLCTTLNVCDGRKSHSNCPVPQMQHSNISHGKVNHFAVVAALISQQMLNSEGFHQLDGSTMECNWLQLAAVWDRIPVLLAP